jgi:hypothetical protein
MVVALLLHDVDGTQLALDRSAIGAPSKAVGVGSPLTGNLTGATVAADLACARCTTDLAGAEHWRRAQGLGEKLMLTVGEGGQGRAQRVMDGWEVLELAADYQCPRFGHHGKELFRAFLVDCLRHLPRRCLDIAPAEAALCQASEKADRRDLGDLGEFASVLEGHLHHVVPPSPAGIVSSLPAPIREEKRHFIAKPAHRGCIDEPVVNNTIPAEALEAHQ